MAAMMLMVASAGSTAAQDDVNCDDFEFSVEGQAEAQAVLDADPSDPNNLDGDGNGVACEIVPEGGLD